MSSVLASLLPNICTSIWPLLSYYNCQISRLAFASAVPYFAAHFPDINTTIHSLFRIIAAKYLHWRVGSPCQSVYPQQPGNHKMISCVSSQSKCTQFTLGEKQFRCIDRNSRGCWIYIACKLSACTIIAISSVYFRLIPYQATDSLPAFIYIRRVFFSNLHLQSTTT